jgi:uncharacterized protein
MDELLKPALYRAEGTAEVPGRPALLGGACAACGYVFFPLQGYGCEKCGATDLGPRALSGAGQLLASARVHLHAGKGRVAPFTVGAVRLDGGPIVRTLIVEEAGPLEVGRRMVATLESASDAEGAPRLDLRFAPEA